MPGIGDCEWEQLSANCRNSLSDYRAVSSLSDYEAVYRAVAELISRYGRMQNNCSLLISRGDPMKRVLLILVCILAAVVMTACSVSDSTQPAAVTVNSDGSISIPLNMFGSGVATIDLENSGTAMQLLAHLGKDGKPKLSWNTCSVCNGSPYAYFEYSNGKLTCKNCGNTFSTDTIGGESRGCYPWAVEKYIEEQDAVTIPAEVISQMEPNFRNWKKGL